MNMQYPFIHRPLPFIGNNIDEEIIKLKQEINILKEKITKLEHEQNKKFLQNDDSFYMVWTNIRSFFIAYSSFMIY